MGAKRCGLETQAARGPPPPGKRARDEAPPLSPRARGRGGGAAEGAEYVVGQVAGSLWPDASPDAPLARLFSHSAAGAPRSLVPVTRESKKRKRTEVEKVVEDQSSSVIQEPPIKPKKVRKNELSKAEKTLANRESTLEQSDEENKEKLFQNKAKPNKSASRVITRTVVNSDKSTTEKQKGKKVTDEMVGRRTVFVGNLPVSCTHQVLKSLFKKYGQIKSVRFRSLVPAEATLSKKLAAIKHKVHPNAKFINAYVVFEEECDAIEALKENGREIASGFHIRVDIASKSSLHDNRRSIFLGNLSYDISDDAVREHFSVCGDVVGVRIVRDRKTGLGKGFGYVLFENTDAVHLALKLNESNLMGRKIRVKRCGKKWKAPQKSADRNTDTARAAMKQNKSDMERKAQVKRCGEKWKAPQKSADENTDAVHLPLKQNESDLMGRKTKVKHCGKKKAPQQSANENTDAVHLPLKRNEPDLVGRKTKAKRCGKKEKAPQKSADQNTDAVHVTLKQNGSDTGRKTQIKHCGDEWEAPQKSADENIDAGHLPLKQNESHLMGRKSKVKHCGKKKAPQKSADANTDAVHLPLKQNESDLVGRKTKAKRCRKEKAPHENADQNTDAVHVALKLNKSNLMGRKIQVKHCGEKWKAPWKSANQSHPLNRADTTLKNRSCSDKKAIPLKKSRKQKVLKTLPRNRAVKKTRQSFDKNNYNHVYYCYKD